MFGASLKHLRTQKGKLIYLVGAHQSGQDGNSLSTSASKYSVEAGLVTHRDTVGVFGSDFCGLDTSVLCEQNS